MRLYSLHGGGFTSPLALVAEEIEAQFEDLSGVLREVAERVVLPAFGKHYEASGLKTHGGLLKAALTQPGANGNILEINGSTLTVGIDYGKVQGSKQALEGRGAIRAKPGKSLRFYDDAGKPIFAKSVRAAPAHPVVFLTQDEFDQIAAGVTQRLIERGASALPK